MAIWLTLPEAAHYLRLSRDAAYKLTQRGKIPASKLASRWRFDQEELDQWLKRQRPVSKGTSNPAGWKPVVGEFSHRVRRRYGSRLRGIYLYGSWAREEASPDSDVDLAVVLSSLADFWKEFHQLKRIAYEVSFGQDKPVVLSVMPIGVYDFQKASIPIIQTIRREGRAIA